MGSSLYKVNPLYNKYNINWTYLEIELWIRSYVHEGLFQSAKYAEIMQMDGINK